MKAKRNGMELFALCTGALVFATSASALARTLPTPPPSEYVDGESSNCVLLDPSQGTLMRLWLAADFSPTNAVIVSFGTDTDHNGDLSPREVVFRLGVDCGVPFVGKEGVVGSPSPTAELSNVLCTPTPNIYAFVLKQPSDVSRRYDLAKVTTHNFTSTNLVVRLSRIGTAIFVR